MTPTRAKRNSRVPERFSSDSHRIELSSTNGETILDYNNKTTSTTHKLIPMSTKIRLKPAVREPLKVKLPKLKRRQQTQAKEQSSKIGSTEVKIHKIKLPSLSSRKHANNGNSNNGNDNSRMPKQQNPTIKTKASTTTKKSTSLETSAQVKHHDISDHSGVSESNSSSKFNDSAISKSSGDYKSTNPANTSLSLDDINSSGMQIIVNNNNSTNDSGIRCPCGVNVDLGVMVECEKCSTWQHGHCINVGTEDDAYEGYVCAFCTLPQGRHQESLRQLTVGDKFQCRFELLESMRSHSAQGKLDSNEVTSKVRFTVDELALSTHDLRRVINSLRVKWRLLNSSGYDAELRIWQNAIWSSNPQENLNQNKTKYFLDCYKDNLKLNIRNMLVEMKKRCQLIKYLISLAESQGNENHQQKYVKLRHSIDEVAKVVDEFQGKLQSLKTTSI